MDAVLSDVCPNRKIFFLWYTLASWQAYCSEVLLKCRFPNPNGFREGVESVQNQPIVPDSATSAFGVPIIRKPNMTDEDVMDRLRNGDPDAVPILFDRFHRLVMKIALRILRDSGEAEDVMQEIFLEIFN